MNVDFCYTLMKYAVAKNTSQGYLSPNDFDVCINTAQNSYLDYLLGEYQKYQPTRPFAPVGFAANQRVRTSIAPLIYEVVLPVDNITGIASFPYGFEQVDAMWSSGASRSTSGTVKPSTSAMKM